MLFHNRGEPKLIQNNPQIKSLYIQQFDAQGNSVPPEDTFLVTDPDGNDFIISESGSFLITEA